MDMNSILANAINNAVNNTPVPPPVPDEVEKVHGVLNETSHDSSPPVVGERSEYADQREEETEQEADVTTNPEPKPHISVKGLDEKAVLISVKRRMYSPYKLDQEESKNYGAGNVNKHLFEGRHNKVKETISKFTEVYTYVKDNTVPWSTGVDMLNIEHYFDFTTGLRGLVDTANQAVDDLYDCWDDEVEADLDRLSQVAILKNKPNLADPSDYPTADDMKARFGIDVRYMPVPTTGDFRVGISDEDKASLQKQLEDAEVNATKHVLNSMVEPMQRAVEKLSVPIGNDGSVFRDTLIDNMVDVAERMNRVNISDDPAVQEKINDLRSLVGTYAKNKDVLRGSQTVREKAVRQIDGLVKQMAGLV